MTMLLGPFGNRLSLADGITLALEEYEISATRCVLVGNKAWVVELDHRIQDRPDLSQVTMYEIFGNAVTGLYAVRRDPATELSRYSSTCPRALLSVSRPLNIPEMHWRRQCTAFERESNRLMTS